MNKKAFTLIEMIVGLVFVLAITVAILVFTGQVSFFIQDKTPDLACTLARSSGGALARLSAGAWENLPDACKHDEFVITKAMVEFDLGIGEREIRRISSQRGANWKEIQVYFNDPSSREQQAEYVLDTMMSRYVERCWLDKAGGGTSPLFSSWWNLIDWGSGSAPTREEDARKLYESVFFTVYGPPTNCMYCAQVKFDPEIKSLVGKDEIESLGAFMRAHPSRRDDRTSVYDSFVDRVQQGALVAPQDFSFAITEAHAVKFVRVNFFGSEVRDTISVIDSLAGALGLTQGASSGLPYINRLVIVPTESMQYPFGKQALIPGTDQPIQCAYPTLG